MTFKALLQEAQHYKTPYEVHRLLDRALQNADDTLFDVKACTEEEHDGIALWTVGMLLSCEKNDRKVEGWFKRHGVRW